MKRLYIAAFVIILSEVFSGCSFDKHAGGSVTTENEVSLSIISKGGEPAASARILLIHGSQWEELLAKGESPIIKTYHADSEANVQMDLPSDLDCHLQINWGDQEGAWRTCTSLFDGDSIQLDTQIVVRGNVIVNIPNTQLKGIYTEGSAIQAKLNSNGTFTMDESAPAHSHLKFLMQSENSTYWIDGPLLSEFDSTILINEPRWVFESFEDGDRNSNADYYLKNAGLWWSHVLRGAVTIPKVSDDGLFLTDSGWSGQGLHINLQADASSLAMVGLDLGDGLQEDAVLKRSVDLTDMSALTFWAKGSGKVRVQFNTNFVAQVLQDGYEFSVEIDLSPQWTFYKILASDIEAPLNSLALSEGYTWSDAASSATAILWLAKEPVDLWLDELALEGVIAKNIFE